MNRYRSVICIAVAALCFTGAPSLALAQGNPGWQNGMGPGMMGGYGMGPGMMGGYDGGFGMGPAMMGWGNFGELNLSADQRTKISQIRREVRTTHWALMGKMMDAQDKLQDLYDVDRPDSTAINNQYKELEQIRRQMVDSSIDARNRVESILTKEQREKFNARRRDFGPMMWGY